MLIDKGRPRKVSSAPLSLLESDSAVSMEGCSMGGGVWPLKRKRQAPDNFIFPTQLLASAICEPPSSATGAPGSEEPGRGAPAPTSDALNCPAWHVHSWPCPILWHKPACLCEARDSSTVSATCQYGITKSCPSLTPQGSNPCEVPTGPVIPVSYTCWELQMRSQMRKSYRNGCQSAPQSLLLATDRELGCQGQ